MIKHKDHFHGSDLEKIEEIYGIKKEEIVSFSANVNPLGRIPFAADNLSRQDRCHYHLSGQGIHLAPQMALPHTVALIMKM